MLSPSFLEGVASEKKKRKKKEKRMRAACFETMREYTYTRLENQKQIKDPSQ